MVARTGIDPRKVPGVHAMQQAACLVQDGAQLAGDAGAEVEDPQKPGAAIPWSAPCTHAYAFSPHLLWGTPSKVSKMMSNTEWQSWQVHMSGAVKQACRKRPTPKLFREAF